MALGRDLKFVPHVLLGTVGKDYILSENDEIHNIVYDTEDEDDKRISVTTYLIANFRSEILDSYVRWCLSINGLYKAHEKYSSHDYNALFRVDAMRIGNDGLPEMKRIVEWNKEETSTNHLKVTGMMGA